MSQCVAECKKKNRTVNGYVTAADRRVTWVTTSGDNTGATGRIGRGFTARLVKSDEDSPMPPLPRSEETPYEPMRVPGPIMECEAV
jgi:hypothetical protein